jgi:hypothetical protein
MKKKKKRKHKVAGHLSFAKTNNNNLIVSGMPYSTAQLPIASLAGSTRTRRICPGLSRLLSWIRIARTGFRGGRR